MSKPIVYRDLDLNFLANPINGDVSVKSNVEAIRQSILLILSTNRREKPFDPMFGTALKSILFENMLPITQAILKQRIVYAIRSFEPRVDILDVAIRPDYERDGYDISLVLTVRGTQDKIVLPVFLERVR
jgi:phage baseplate assembly protein W